MKVLFDTNVAIAALVETHPNHSKAFPWLRKAKEKEIDSVIGAHSLAEIYSILTTLPIQPKLSPTQAEKLIQQNFVPHFEIVALTKEDYLSVLHILVANNVQGGATYDALIGHAAFKAQAEKLPTFNDKHFKRAYPAIAHLIEVPK
jgi:predicted nucleic acid-binding protein